MITYVQWNFPITDNYEGNYLRCLSKRWRHHGSNKVIFLRTLGKNSESLFHLTTPLTRRLRMSYLITNYKKKSIFGSLASIKTRLWKIPLIKTTIAHRPACLRTVYLKSLRLAHPGLAWLAMGRYTGLPENSRHVEHYWWHLWEVSFIVASGSASNPDTYARGMVDVMHVGRGKMANIM